jgi:hypothetical protein
MKTIRIFVSSPGDVAIDRDKARNVVEGLQKRYAGRQQLEIVRWEDLPLGVVDSLQGGIARDKRLGLCSLKISRFGRHNHAEKTNCCQIWGKESANNESPFSPESETGDKEPAPVDELFQLSEENLQVELLCKIESFERNDP